MKLPIKIGTASGHNASIITDADDDAFCSVYGMFLHTTVAEAEKMEAQPRNTEHRKAMQDARSIVRAVNAHDAMVTALKDALGYVSCVAANATGKAKQRNYAGCAQRIEDALKQAGVSVE